MRNKIEIIVLILKIKANLYSKEILQLLKIKNVLIQSKAT